MCVIFTAADPNPDYKCVLAMNRDESFFRNTAPLQYWPGMGIYCGKDLVKGGTCLGINKKGWFVAITNKRTTEIKDPSGDSRGEITLKLLSHSIFDPNEWEILIKNFKCTNFNVLFGDLSDENVKIYAYSSETTKLIEIPRNDDTFTIFSLANGDVQDSKWFKQQRGENLIQNSIPEISEDSLFNILTDSSRGSNDLEDFKNFPIFVKPINSRGTISSSVILVNHEGKVDFIEKSWNLDQSPKYESRISFIIEK